MNRPSRSRRHFLTTLCGLGSLSALTVDSTYGQQQPLPAPIVVNNQYRIKAKLIHLFPDYMVWADKAKQEGDKWIGVITHGTVDSAFRDEIATEKLQKTASGRTVHWVLYNTVEDLLKATPAGQPRWHLIFVMWKNADVVQDDLAKLDRRFHGKQGVVLVTEENTAFRTLSAINFWENVEKNRIGIQLRHKYLAEDVGVTPKKEMLSVDGITLYDKPAPAAPARQ